MEFLETNIEWLVKSLEVLCKKSKDAYLLFDFPGQIELYTHHNSGNRFIKLIKKIRDDLFHF